MEDDDKLIRKIDEFEQVISKYLPSYITVPSRMNKNVKLKDLIKKYLTRVTV